MSAGAPSAGLSVLGSLLLAVALQLPSASGASALVRVQSPTPGPAGTPEGPPTAVLPEQVLASMNERFVEFNEHWDEAPRMNSITQMLRSGGPTQLEYMGCLRGTVSGDTVRIRDWTEARELVQLQFGVDGICEHVEDLLGTWHTHPFRADPDGRPIKSRGLSPSDLESFAAGDHRMILVLWDVDSVAVALRNGEGEVVHPAPLVVR